MTLVLEPEHRDDPGEHLYTRDEIRAFLKNAELAATQGVAGRKRLDVLRKVKTVFHEEMKHWHDNDEVPELQLTWPEIVCLFSSLAHEFFMNTPRGEKEVGYGS